MFIVCLTIWSLNKGKIMHTYFHYIFKIEDIDMLDYIEDELSKNLKDMLLGEEFLVYPYRSSEKINMQSIYSALIDFYFRYLKKNNLKCIKPSINFKILLEDENEIFTSGKDYFFMASLYENSKDSKHLLQIKFKCVGRSMK